MKPLRPPGPVDDPNLRRLDVEERARREAEALINEHAAANDPDRIDAVARRRLMLFSERTPCPVDLLVVDVLRARATILRTDRRC
jgi:hypothetical protein